MKQQQWVPLKCLVKKKKKRKKNTHIDYFQYVRNWIYSFVDSHERWNNNILGSP